MKILLISWYFPPFNTIGAVRAGKLAKHLHRHGHEVRVTSAGGQALPRTLPLEIPEACVDYTGWADVNKPVALAAALRNRLRRGADAEAVHGPGHGPAQGPAQASNNGANGPDLFRRLSDLYNDLAHIPDQRIGWLPAAVRSGARLGRDWRPDVILASGPPFTGFLAARRLGQRLGVPWVAEFRDRWADDAYVVDVAPAWRNRLFDWLERRTVRSAAGIVTVSEPWSDFFRTKYALPVATVYNGFDPDDFPLDDGGDGGGAAPQAGLPLTIAYTGQIYSGRRDPSPLFQALARLGPARGDVRVVFHGSAPGLVLPAARAAGVEDLVEVRPAVPYDEAIRLQRQADVLLLLQWNHPNEQGNVPAKLFEYFGVLRPILGLGLEDGVPAGLIGERSAGLFANDPAVIARQIEAWIAMKREGGTVPALPASAREGLSRDVQFDRLVRFLEEVRRGRPVPAAGAVAAHS